MPLEEKGEPSETNATEVDVTKLQNIIGNWAQIHKPEIFLSKHGQYLLFFFLKRARVFGLLGEPLPLG